MAAVARFPAEREAKRSALLQAVAGLRETIERHAHEAEAAGTLPLPVVEVLIASGVLRLKMPAVLGGAEADPITQIDVIEALSAIEPSVAWCTMVGATGLALPGAFLGDAAVAEVFPSGSVPTAAVVAMPAGKAVPVAGGYRLTGRWPFASGVRHARWITLGAQVDRGAGTPPEVRFLTLLTSALTLHDNWSVAGLEGTGSCDVSAADVFVADVFTWDRQRDPPKRGGPLYRLPNPGFVANEHAAFALGVGRAALDEVTAFARSKRRGFTAAPTSLEARGVFQRFVGESDLRLAAARALTKEAYAEASALLESGEVTPALQAKLRACATHATVVAAEVVTGAFRFAGGAAAYRTGRLQRLLRDINVGAQHLIVSDITYENHAQFMLGLPGADPMR